MSDYLVFIQNARTNKMVIVIIYVNNFFVFGLNKSEINDIKW